MLATAATFLRKYPFHFAIIVVCAYPMIMVHTGKYDESLGIVPKDASGAKERGAK